MPALTDETLIAEQIGRTPRGVVTVAARCPAGHPSVVTTYPLIRAGQRVVPFPTLYWLTCPRLCEEISHLERVGAIADISAEMARDEMLRARLLHDHDDYIAQRWAALTAKDRQLVSRLGLLDVFHTRGIGGMVNRAAVKCLHLHLAHHLVRGNVIGELVADRYGVRPCGAA